MNRLEIKEALQKAIEDSTNLADSIEVLWDQHPNTDYAAKFAGCLGAQRRVTQELLDVERKKGWAPPSRSPA